MNRKNIFVVITCLSIQMGAYAQHYLNYRTTYTPITSCFAPQGELKLSLTRQLYWPDMGWAGVYNAGYRARATLEQVWRNYLLVNDNRVNVSYAYSDNISLHSCYFHTIRYNIFNVEGANDNITFDGNTNAFNLGATYHKDLLPFLQWEAGSSIMFGSGHFIYKEYLLPDNYTLTKSHLRYTTFNHNFLLGISYKHKKLQVTAQLNMGYLRHYNIEYDPIYPFSYEHIGQHFYAHQADYYIDPALLVNINFSRIGFQLHGGLPISFGESKINRAMPTVGIGLSYKLIKSKTGKDSTEL
ncbi:hypothetical protein [Perlabentimonas gracilis]|uniref:hypothetical protein n=1 Tax=Perlabentimonas gracilis TaxID=2715279 RepID=UPI00140E09D9|nr:hypothetical protein [Perlabentimonas gracilis]NHB69261.1 hypothetical protein [Perlabentimonas gracilis]